MPCPEDKHEADTVLRARPAPAQRRGPSAVLLLIVLLPATVACMYYYPSISGAVAMRAWSRREPVAVVAGIGEALRSGDPALIEAACPGAKWNASPEAASTVTPPSRGGTSARFEVPQVAASATAPQPRTRYRLDRRQVEVYVTTEDGGTARYILERRAGKWHTMWFAPE